MLHCSLGSPPGFLLTFAPQWSLSSILPPQCTGHVTIAQYSQCNSNSHRRSKQLRKALAALAVEDKRFLSGWVEPKALRSTTVSTIVTISITDTGCTLIIFACDRARFSQKTGLVDSRLYIQYMMIASAQRNILLQKKWMGTSEKGQTRCAPFLIVFRSSATILFVVVALFLSFLLLGRDCFSRHKPHCSYRIQTKPHG